jgi:glucosamine-6-phosphate isomerase
MRLLRFDDSESAGRAAAEIIVSSIKWALREKANPIFVPSAGRTPVTTYRTLRDEYTGAIDWSRVVVYQMDEYLGEPIQSLYNYRRFLTEHLIEPLGIKKFNFFTDNCGRLLRSPPDYEKQLLTHGGIDFVFFGIGENAHIGFNEPGSSYTSNARCVSLTPSTRAVNDDPQAGYETPKEAVTLGISALAAARCAVLLAIGKAKREAIYKMLRFPQSPNVPAAALRTMNSLTVIVDSAALPNDIEQNE